MINVIIPAAGEATRLKPLTNNTSKAMVRIHGKPVIDFILDSVYRVSNQIVIVDGKIGDLREHVLKSYFSNKVSFVKQCSPLGPRDAVRLGFSKISNLDIPTAVWLGDTILLDTDIPFGEDFLSTKEVYDHFSWCVWDGERFYDKPEKTIENGKALIGVYGFKNSEIAKTAFNITDSYDISPALKRYSENCASLFDRHEAKEWFDIGTLSSYHKTCAVFLTKKARCFNYFEYDEDLNSVTKISSGNDGSIYHEKCWYSDLSDKQKMLTPKILLSDNDDSRLTLSYESGMILSDLYANEDIPNSTIDYLTDKVVSTVRHYFHTPITRSNYFLRNAEKLWVEKTRTRLETIGFSKNTIEFYRDVANRCLKSSKPVSVMHGDLHLGNIIYNQYNNSLLFIDPRGKFGDHIGCMGDQLYDLCKLSHDMYHGYHNISFGLKYPDYCKDKFVSVLKDKYPADEDMIIDGGALLIATCIPLHYDDKNRQQRMKDYANEYFFNRS